MLCNPLLENACDTGGMMKKCPLYLWLAPCRELFYDEIRTGGECRGDWRRIK